MKIKKACKPSKIQELLLCVVIGCLISCNNADSPASSEQLRSARRAVQTLQSENQQLKTAYHKLQSDHFALQAAYENLELQERDLAQWAQQLAAKYGPSVWYFGKTERPLPYRNMSKATPQELVHELNVLFAQSKLPQVALTKVDDPTAYVHVADDFKLTHNMGTAGATSYIQVVTYTLTSLPAIDSVAFDFKEGDHAMPGRYQR